MDAREENRRQLGRDIVIIISVLLCSAGSGFFTWVGANISRGIIGRWPEFIWIVWGVAWGAICGGVIAYLLTRALLKRRVS